MSKANEAPEQIWINPSMDLPKLNGVINKDSIQYVRKDAFIERALKFLDENFCFNNLHYAVENNTFNCMEELFEDFKKYMEG